MPVGRAGRRRAGLCLGQRRARKVSVGSLRRHRQSNPAGSAGSCLLFRKCMAEHYPRGAGHQSVPARRGGPDGNAGKGIVVERDDIDDVHIVVRAEIVEQVAVQSERGAGWRRVQGGRSCTVACKEEGADREAADPEGRTFIAQSGRQSGTHSSSSETYNHPQPRLTPMSTKGSCRTLSFPSTSMSLSMADTSIVRPTVPVPQTTAATCLIPGNCRAGAASRLTSVCQS